MRIVAYTYSDPLLETPPDPTIWGWDVDRIYQDLGKRQQLAELLTECETDGVDYLLVRQLEELGDSARQVRDRLLKLQSLGVRVVATQSEIDCNPSDLHHLDLLELFDRVQTHQRSRRIRQGHARKRVKALPPPGKPPYGYRRGKDRYAIDRATAPVVKDFFEHFLLYGSLRGAVRYLAKRYGKKISVSTGRRWLTNPAYRGDLAYHNGETIADTHVPILSREEAAQVDRLLRRNRRLPPRTASAPRSLAGLVVCGECQTRLTVARVTRRGKQQEYLYLRPDRCPKQPKCRALPYQAILEQTIDRICRDFTRAVEGLSLPDMDRVKESLQEAIADKEKILAQLPDLQQQGILDPETAEWRAYKLRTELSELQSKLAQLPPVNLRSTAKTVSIRQFWFDLSESERRFYFREFIRHIEIHRHEEGWDLDVAFIF